MQLKSVCFVKIYISGCCVDTYLNSSRTDSKEKRCRAEADPSPRPSRGEGAGRCAQEPSEVFPLGAFWECVGPVSVALSWSGLQGAFVYPSPPPFPWGRGLVAALRCVVLPAGGRTGSVPVRASVPGFPSPHALFL